MLPRIKYKKFGVVEKIIKLIAYLLNLKIGILVGSNSILIKGRKLSVKLVFNGSDLKNAVNGKTKKGKVTLASVKI